VDTGVLKPMTVEEWDVLKAKMRLIKQHKQWVKNVMLPYMEEQRQRDKSKSNRPKQV